MPSKPIQQMEKVESELEARSKAARFAVANTVIEGGLVLPETEELMNEWARCCQIRTNREQWS